MRFALVENDKVEATPGLKGLCPGCQKPVTAVCGEQRFWHWRHIPKHPCSDRWWEAETQWHRDWKNKFPREWQEIIHHDEQSGEKHIADVRTKHGLIIEFQHSHLDPQEQRTRERFYKNLVWVVDGTRLKNDFKRFCKGIVNRTPLLEAGYFLLAFPAECFSTTWLKSSVMVLFDFQGINPIAALNPMSKILWCLLPNRAEGNAVIAGISREQFVDVLSSRPSLLKFSPHDTINVIAEEIRKDRAEENRRYQQPNYLQFARRPRRRF